MLKYFPNEKGKVVGPNLPDSNRVRASNKQANNALANALLMRPYAIRITLQ